MTDDFRNSKRYINNASFHNSGKDAAPLVAGAPSLFVQDSDFTLYVGDVRDCLRELPDQCVHTVVTSPPYWGLRDYGTGLWEGGDPECDHDPVAKHIYGCKGCGVHMNETTPGCAHCEDRHLKRSINGTQQRVIEERDPSRPDLPNPPASWAKRDATTRTLNNVCSKCGAARVDQQLGLEPTPEAFVAAMVDVFREVRRVLRDDGTLWLNLGDSYAGSWGAQSREAGQPVTSGEADGLVAAATGLSTNQIKAHPKRTNTGSWVNDHPALKPKDLVGIPWRVAFALQQPYYTGRIKDERDRIWLAAMVEAEGCMFIHKRKVGQSNGQGYVRKTDTYGSGLEVASTDRAIVERCLAIAGKGSIGTVERGNDTRRRQTLYRWMLRSNVCRDVIRELYPHMVAKQHEARLLLGCPSSGDDAARAHASLKAIHQGEAPTIDFPAPTTLFEPGWYLRSDVIWSKANPMPESVTDRPTKAHEYVFLLSKAPRYFFDQEAVREPADRAGETIKGDRAPGGLVNGGWLKGGIVAAGRNVRTVWEIATQPYPDAHFATFPEALPERCIKAGTSERGCCPECGAPWVRRTEKRYAPSPRHAVSAGAPGRDDGYVDSQAYTTPRGDGGGDQGAARSSSHVAGLVRADITLGWTPSCRCDTANPAEDLERARKFSPVPCTVLDPFMGSGTTALVARRLGRKSIGVELNPSYAELCARRLQQLSLLA